MAKASVYSILAALLIAIQSTTAYLSNIHEQMTDSERLAVFGSLAQYTQYEILPMSLMGLRRARKSNEDLSCMINLGSEELTLNLKATTQYLVTKNVRVWSAVSDPDTPERIHYRLLPTAMRGVGEFTMYQDVKNAVSLAVYTDPNEEIVIEGSVSTWYALRSLPKRLFRQILNEAENNIDTSNILGGELTSNEDAGFYAAIFIHMLAPVPAPTALQHDIHDNHQREKRAKRNRGRPKAKKIVKVPNTLYPEMLIVLDRNLVRNRTTTQALRNVLAFWNGMDLIYRTLDKPEIRLNIAGIIIAADDMATPYIAKNASELVIGDLDGVLSKMGKHFYKELARFPTNRYDIIIAMTTMNLCADNTDFCRSNMPVSGYANRLPFCTSQRDSSRTETLSNTMIIHYEGIFTREHVFLVQDNNGYDKNDECHLENHNSRNDIPTFEWSNCSKNFYSHIFTPKNTECLLNKPLSLTQVNKVLPGGLLSMDRQCRNEGYSESCKLAIEIGPCEAKGCRDEVSKGCVRSRRVPLPGSQCGADKYCNRMKQCVYK